MKRAVLLSVAVGLASATTAAQDYRTWKDYGGGSDSSHYVELDHHEGEHQTALDAATEAMWRARCR